MGFLRFMLMGVFGVGFAAVYHVAVPVVFNTPTDPINTFIAGLVGAAIGIGVGIAGDLLVKE